MQTYIKNKKYIILFFITIIIIVNSYINYLNKQHLILIKDIKEFNKISNDFIYFEDSRNNNIGKLIASLLRDISKEEKRNIYYFDISFLIYNSIINQNELNEILEKYEIKNLPVIIKLNDGLLEKKLEIEKQEIITKETLREFITDIRFPIKHVPQYTITIILFIISILLTMLLFTSKIKFKSCSNNIEFIILMTIISNTILLILSTISSIQYIDNYSLSGNPNIFTIFMGAIISNFISLIKLAFEYKFK